MLQSLNIPNKRVKNGQERDTICFRRVELLVKTF